MKKTTRWLCMALIAVMTLTAGLGAACSRDPSGIKIDPKRTQLYVSSHDGGYGSEWLTAASARFEEYYKDVSFEDGKTGVQIIPDTPKVIGTAMLADIKNSRNEVIFTESVYYYDYLAAGAMAEVTDIVSGKNSDLTEYGDEGGNIEGKLTEQQIAYYKTSDGKYYGVPHYAAFMGIMYDVDLFEEKMFYFSADENNGNDGFIVKKNDKRSAGPDGEFCEICAANGYDYSGHTCDDGLPATYGDFVKLCDYIVGAGVTPLIWSGENHADTLGKFMAQLAADFEGSEYALNFSFDGTATHLVKSVDASGNVTYKEPTKIQNSNGSELYSSAGRYYAVDFVEKILSKSNYHHDLAFNTTHSHMDAQDDFLYSKDEDRRIAMLIDGNWWENEADGTFADMSNGKDDDPNSRHSRRIGYMPLPKATEDQVGEGVTLTDFLYSMGFINANVTDPVKLDLAKKFLKFVNSQESLEEFTVITSAPKSLEYEMSEESLEKMTYFGQSVWSTRQHATVIYPYSTNRLYLNHQSDFVFQGGFNSLIGGQVVTDISKKINDEHISAKEVFDGIVSYRTAERWNATYSGEFK